MIDLAPEVVRNHVARARRQGSAGRGTGRHLGRLPTGPVAAWRDRRRTATRRPTGAEGDRSTTGGCRPLCARPAAAVLDSYGVNCVFGAGVNNVSDVSVNNVFGVGANSSGRGVLVVGANGV